MTITALIDTFWYPEKTVTCQMPSFTVLFRFLPILLQCALLHQKFSTSSLMRQARLLLAPLNFYIGLTLPINFCFVPLVKRGGFNLFVAGLGFHLATKALEWARTGFWDGKYWTRPEYNTSTPGATGTITRSPGTKTNWKEVVYWAIEQASSMRGMKFGWGQEEANAQVPTFASIVRRLYLDHIVRVCSTAFLVLTRDNKGNASQALSVVIKADFLGKPIIAEALATLSFGLFLIAGIDMIFCEFIVFFHGVHFIHKSFISLPQLILDLCDPRFCPPAFNSPHTATSLAWLWGKGWHQVYRRNFLMCGAIPASRLAKRLGAQKNVQNICGLFGAFSISALLHEFIIHHIARKPHPAPHIYFKEFPSAALFFLLQPIGIIIEPYIIPYIPRVLGGGHAWVFGFALLTGTPFRKQYTRDFRFLDQGYLPLNQWSWISILIPACLMQI